MDEPEQTVEDVDDLPALTDDDGADPFDDATAVDLDTGIDIDIEERSSEDSEPAGDRIDVGNLDESIAMMDSTAGDEGDQEGMVGEDESEIDLDRDSASDDDGGTEGTGEAIEDEINEADLPELDADEQGDYEEDSLADLLLMEATQNVLPPWDAMRWVVVEGAGAPVPCGALAVAADRIVAAGDVVLIVDEGAHAVHKKSFGSGAVSVAVTDEMIVLGTRRGGLLVVAQGATNATPLAGWRSRTAPVELAATPGRVWVRSDEELWSMSTPRTPPVAVRDRGVLGIASAGGTLVALTRTATGLNLERLRGDDEGWQVTPLAGEPEGLLIETAGVRMAAAAAGRRIAFGTQEGIRLSSDAGLSFHSIALPGTLAIAFAGDDEDAPLLALTLADRFTTTYLVQIPVVGSPTRVIGLGGVESPPSATALDRPTFAPASLAWDNTRDLAWIACPAGLLAVGRARKH